MHENVKVNEFVLFGDEFQQFYYIEMKKSILSSTQNLKLATLQRHKTMTFVFPFL
jgi:hypothetical protein